MRTARMFVLAAAALAVAVSGASAQTGTIGFYFDSGFSVQQKNCADGTLDMGYVAAVGFNTFLAGAEYQIIYPGSMFFLGDVDTPPATVGNSATGISMGFALPQNGYLPVLLHKVNFLWQCPDGCNPTNQPIIVVPNPFTVEPVVVTQWPDYALIEGIGLTSLVCATIPTEETSWGGIKALYE